MYDSRTDQPRLRHAHTYCRGGWSAPRERQSKDQAIAEGLADREDEQEDTDVQGF